MVTIRRRAFASNEIRAIRRSAARGKLSSAKRAGYLPMLQKSDPQNPQWRAKKPSRCGQLEHRPQFFSQRFAREHNLFVDEFRRKAAASPTTDSGLRDPAAPERPIYTDIRAEELFEVARLSFPPRSKIHTIEWTPDALNDRFTWR